MQTKRHTSGTSERRLLCYSGSFNQPEQNERESTTPQQSREDPESRRQQLHQRKDDVVKRIHAIKDRVNNPTEWEAYEQQFLQDFERWNTEYNRTSTEHNQTVHSNVDALLKRYERQVSSRETVRENEDDGELANRPSVTGSLERIRDNVWAIEIPDGSQFGFRFDTNMLWQSLKDGETSMGDMNTNGFHVSRDPANENRIIIQSDLPFSYVIKGTEKKFIKGRVRPKEKAEEVSQQQPEETTEERDVVQNERQRVETELRDLSPEEVAEMKNQHMQLLLSYREMTQSALLAQITTEEVARHEKEGTLYVLFLAINSKDRGNFAEESSNPVSMYEAIIDNVVEEGMELRNEVVEAKKMSAADLREKLRSPPFADFFKQEKLPRVDIQLSRLHEEQLRTLYESCLLEQQVRDANIRYTAGGSFCATTLPENRYTVYRQGDCNTVANFYYSLASLSGSEGLSSSLKSIVVDGHAQVGFDIGTDNSGQRIMLSKNTSHVDMSKVDAEGRWTGKNYPYVHNFYGIQHDIDGYGVTMDKALQGADALVAAQIGELRNPDLKRSQSSDADLLRQKELSETVLHLNPYDATENSNYISGIFMMQDRGLISEADAKDLVGGALENYIETSYWSGFSLINFTRRFGRPAARDYLIKYENKIMGDGTGFSRFVRSSVGSMRDIPDFDRKLTGTESSVSLDVENRRNMLRSIERILPAQRARQNCRKELEFLSQEMEGWKRVSR